MRHQETKMRVQANKTINCQLNSPGQTAIKNLNFFCILRSKVMDEPQGQAGFLSQGQSVYS